ncbi:cytidylyltransferase domain-containing protein [Inediibacterium massiliense]|uniref:cytidylyltransferase domain-containing protein n=1 Tax=Inediibacterium massiliense TaxID=1658111 RepID=UPI0006B5F144|nr:hypothetical protein [Inediibacterium massiliense]
MRIGFIIIARLKSTRLPFKVIKDLGGKMVIERIIDRAKKVQGISEIILCTSMNPQDKPLIEIAKKNDIYYFNGNDVDVVQRLLDAAKFFRLDYIVGITADDPLFTIDYSNLIVNEIEKNKYDYIKIKGLPLGCATYGVNVKTLETVCNIKNVIDTEIWGALIDRPEVFNIKEIEVQNKLKRPDLRLTLDYEEDYELFRILYNKLQYNDIINLYDVVDYIDKNPEIKKINEHCIQATLSNEKLDKINKYYLKNHDKIMKIKEEVYKS